VERRSSQSRYNPTKALIFSSRAQCLEQLMSTYNLEMKSRYQPFVQTYQLAATAKIRRNPMNKNASRLFAETRSVEKIMVLTSCPCAVPNPVRRTTPRHPPSGVCIGEGISEEGVACRILVPQYNTVFLCTLSTSRASLLSHSWMDSFSRGVDSPESMASLTMMVPLIRRMSAGTLVSAWERAG